MAIDEHPWWMSTANLVRLTAYLARSGYSAEGVAHAVEKPWEYEEEWLSALFEVVQT